MAKKGNKANNYAQVALATFRKKYNRAVVDYTRVNLEEASEEVINKYKERMKEAEKRLSNHRKSM